MCILLPANVCWKISESDLVPKKNQKIHKIANYCITPQILATSHEFWAPKWQGSRGTPNKWSLFQENLGWNPLAWGGTLWCGTGQGMEGCRREDGGPLDRHGAANGWWNGHD